jgi:hypothetical protein
VSFLPLDLTDPDSIDYVISHIDFTMQYGEDEEPKEVMYYPLKFRRVLHMSFRHTYCLHLVQPRDLDEGDFQGMD